MLGLCFAIRTSKPYLWLINPCIFHCMMVIFKPISIQRLNMIIHCQVSLVKFFEGFRSNNCIYFGEFCIQLRTRGNFTSESTKFRAVTVIIHLTVIYIIVDSHI